MQILRKNLSFTSDPYIISHFEEMGAHELAKKELRRAGGLLRSIYREGALQALGDRWARGAGRKKNAATPPEISVGSAGTGERHKKTTAER